MMASYPENDANKDLEKMLPIISKCLLILKNKIAFCYAIANFIFFTIICMGVLVYGLIHPSKKFWLTYGPISLASISLNIQLIVCFICSSKWEATKLIYVTQFSWDLETLPLEAKNKILRTWKQIDTDFVVGCVLVACATIAVLKEITPGFWNIVSALDLVEEYVPHFRWMVIASIWINSHYMTFMVLMATYYLFVPTILMRTQLVMLYSGVDEFKKIALEYQPDKYVEESLKSITKRHQNILRIYGILKNNAFIPLFLMTTALFISFLYTTIIFQSNYYGIVSPITIYFAALILAAYFSSQGQHLEDEFQDFSTLLYDLNWYEWSINNMKTFKTLFLNASVPITASDVSLFRINHSYFKESIKMVYTLINLARTFSHH